jgi:hypothetical protein
MEWDHIFRSGAVDDLEGPLFEVVKTYEAGFYVDVAGSMPRPGEGPFFLETFAPSPATRLAYENRMVPRGVALNLLISRVGLLAPEPGGIALYSLGSLAQIGDMILSTPPGVVGVGCYEVAGREIA